MPNIFLTDDLVLSASCPSGKDQEIYWDNPVGADGRIRNNSVSGLGLRVTKLGRMAFIHDYQLNGQRCRKVVGSTLVYNVASARMEVIKRTQQLQEGTDPEADRIDIRRKHFMTVRDAVDRYWESHITGLSKNYRYSFTLFVAKWRRGVAPKRPDMLRFEIAS